MDTLGIYVELGYLAKASVCLGLPQSPTMGVALWEIKPARNHFVLLEKI